VDGTGSIGAVVLMHSLINHMKDILGGGHFR
jgi:hypothetical protein